VEGGGGRVVGAGEGWNRDLERAGVGLGGDGLFVCFCCCRRRDEAETGWNRDLERGVVGVGSETGSVVVVGMGAGEGRNRRELERGRRWRRFGRRVVVRRYEEGNWWYQDLDGAVVGFCFGVVGVGEAGLRCGAGTKAGSGRRRRRRLECGTSGLGVGPKKKRTE
jgi:hypothetical protein